MHELSIATALLDAAESEAARQGLSRVTAIHVQVGVLSGVVKRSLENAYELARAGTALQNAALVVEEVPVAVYCPRCATERPVTSIQLLCCSTCGTATAEIVRGSELQLVALEIES